MAAAYQVEQSGGDLALARLPAGFLERGVVRGGEAEQRLEAQRRADLRVRQQALGVVDGQRAGRGHEVDAVRQRQPFLGLQDQPLDPGARHGSGAGEQLALVPGLPGVASIAIDAIAIGAVTITAIAIGSVPRQHGGDVRQWGQIATGAQRAFGGHARRHAGVEHVDQRLRHDRPHAGMTLGQHVGADGHHGAHDFAGQRVANPADAQQDQVARELSRLVRADLPVSQGAEAGVHAVDDLALPANRIGHPRVAGRHARLSGTAQGRHARMMPGYRDQLVDCQCAAGKFDHEDVSPKMGLGFY